LITPDNLAIISISDHLERWNLSKPENPEVSGPEEYTNDMVGPFFADPSKGVIEFAQLDTGIRSYNFSNGIQSRFIKLSTKSSGVAGFSPDGSRFALVEPQGKIIIKQVETGKIELILSGQKGNLTNLCFSKDGSLLGSGSDDKSILAWNLGDEELLSIINLPSAPQQCAFSTDNKLLIVRTAGEVYIYSLEDGVMNNYFKGFNFQLSRDGTALAISSRQDGKDLVSIFDLKTGITSMPIEESSHHISLSPDGKILAAAADSIVLWNTSDLSKIYSLDNQGKVGPTTFSDDGKFIIQYGWDGSYEIWGIP
jgi:WD40 repeat protein